MTRIHTAAVLGAGTMGAQIAAHLANAGVPVRLLDLDRKTADTGLKRALKMKPAPFFTRDAAALVTTGGFDTDLPGLSEADWIVEAIVERLDVKRELLRKVEPHRAADAIVSSNTSGIPIATIADGLSDDFRRHWLGTHFFNPPRYLPLVEVIPTADTETTVVETIRRFLDHELGKGVVVARDTPNFIGNRIGVYGVMRVLDLLAAGDYTIEEIDTMSGRAVGRPKSATFRTMDIAGIDVLAHVACNLAEQLDETERAAFVLPDFVGTMVERGLTGAKAGQGFYRKDRSSGEILTLDPSTLEYRARRKATLPAIEAARSIDDLGERIRTLFLGKDRVGAFLRATLGKTLLYTAEVTPTIAHSIDDVDRAMRWGYGWELGPFEIWDVIGVDDVLTACKVTEPPALVAELSGERRFRAGEVPAAAADLQILRTAKERENGVGIGIGIIRRNPGASLVDLGDGVLGVEFHSKMNAIGGDTVAMLTAGMTEASQNFDAVVVGNDNPQAFSAGANLMLVLLEAQEENWDEIDLMIRAFQMAVIGLRYADVPVVVAPAGLTLGGGCEITLHGDRTQAAAETYMGQVEVGVGLIPAGGGCKELVARAMDGVPGGGADPLPYLQKTFELIGFGKVSTSGPDALQMGLLRDVDAFTMNRERLMADAKSRALALASAGYQPPPRRDDIPVGGEGVRAALELGLHLAWRGGRISDHDLLIGRTLARILAGGDVPHATVVSEQYLLDLERETFLSLCGEPKTQERMAYTLKTGKTLRN